MGKGHLERQTKNLQSGVIYNEIQSKNLKNTYDSR